MVVQVADIVVIMVTSVIRCVTVLKMSIATGPEDVPACQDTHVSKPIYLVSINRISHVRSKHNFDHIIYIIQDQCLPASLL